MIKIGLLGLGTVGSKVYAHYLSDRDRLARLIGDEIEISRILVKDINKERPFKLPPHLLTSDCDDLLFDTSLNIIVSLLGDAELERSTISRALSKQKRVVTANKFTIAKYGPDLFRTARINASEILFEAAVCGGIQIVDNLLTRYGANDMTGAFGILNGTTNYMLGKMEQGMSYSQALSCAVMEGYAEPDPSADVNGSDAACKLAIIAGLMGRGWVDPEEIYTEGITDLSTRDFRYAKEFGYVIKLIASCKSTDDGHALMVAPTLVWHEHPLASVYGAMNAVYLEGHPITMTKLEGPGAGGDPTAASVWSDIVNAASHVAKNYVQPMPKWDAGLIFVETYNIVSQHYLRMVVKDENGCMAAITSTLADCGIGIDQQLQPRNAKNREKGLAEIVIMTEPRTEGMMAEALKRIQSLDVCVKVGSQLRVLEMTPGPDEDLEE